MFTSREDEVSIIAYSALSACSIFNSIGLDDFAEAGLTIKLLDDKELETHHVNLTEEDEMYEPFDLDDTGEEDDDGRNCISFKSFLAAQTKEMILCQNWE